MSRREVKEALFSDMNVSAVLDLLGPVSSDNRRIYAGWPQQQPKLTSHEPAEGWVTFHEREATIPWGSIDETFVFEVNIFATRHSIGEDVLDVLDGKWHHKLAGHNGRVMGSDRNVVFSARIMSYDMFESDEFTESGPKLHRKVAVYQFRTVRVPYNVGT